MACALTLQPPEMCLIFLAESLWDKLLLLQIFQFWGHTNSAQRSALLYIQKSILVGSGEHVDARDRIQVHVIYGKCPAWYIVYLVPHEMNYFYMGQNFIGGEKLEASIPDSM